MSTATGAAAHGPVFDGMDWTVVAIFVAVMLAVVVMSMLKTAKSGKDYFLSGRDSGWLQIGSSIYSSNIADIEDFPNLSNFWNPSLSRIC